MPHLPAFGSRMLAKLACHPASLDEHADRSLTLPESALHALIVLPAGSQLPDRIPCRDQLMAVLKRRAMKIGELAKQPLALDLPGGGRYAYVMVDPAQARFSQLSILRKAAMLLLEETPSATHVEVCAADRQLAMQLAREALYVLWLNGAALPVRKKKPAKPLKSIVLHGDFKSADFAAVAALAEANTLARELTALPPNELTPGNYREKVRVLAKAKG